MLAALGKAKYFTTLDLKSGYWKIPLNEEDKEKTAFTFTYHRGLHEYIVMPFGLANALEYSKNSMSIVLHGLGNFSMASLDDIIIFHAPEEEHKQCIPKMLIA